MRKSFYGLGSLVTNELGQNVMNGSVFIFINRRRDKIKLLVWDESGFVIYYKSLEKGTFEIPKMEGDSKQIKWSDLLLILEGVELKSVKRRPRYRV
jgi:transposase